MQDILHPLDSFGIQKVPLSGIRIERLEDRVKPGVPFPHKHDFFQILLLKRGAGEHQIDFRRYRAGAKQVYVMKPGQMHAWTFQKGVSGILVEFSYDSLDPFKESAQLIHTLGLAPDFLGVASAEEFTELEALAEILLRESTCKRELFDTGLRGLLVGFIVNLLRQFQKPAFAGKSLTTVDRFRELLEVKFRSEHGVTFYATELRTSPKALTMQLTRSIGRAPRELIQARILLEAKRYLAFSELSIADVGFELGFSDANYFTRFFRVHARTSPAAFRREFVSRR